jgi:DNA-binding LacI/PurR family transcriptional regulator
MNIKQVADRARLSTATVSRVINGSSQVKEKTAERVWRAVGELGYYRNTHARALVSGRSHMLGLIISDIVNPFFPELMKSFENCAIQQGYEVIVANTDYKQDRMALSVRRIIERKVDGVAIMTSEMDPQLIEELSSRKLPIVFFDTGKAKPLISDISVNYGTGIEEAVQHLMLLRHRQIAFISGPSRLKSARLRRSAFEHALKRSGAADSKSLLVVEGNHRVDGGQMAMQQLLWMPNRPTAVLCSNDLTAIGALHAIAHAGLRVPEDISVVGFDDIELCQYTQPALTTIRLSRQEIGRKAFEALLDCVEGRARNGKVIRIGTGLVMRESTAVARPASARKK